MMKIVFLFGFIMVSCVIATEMTAPNPVRRIVIMLQKMQEKVQKDGEREADLFEKFMCYCKTSEDSLAASIDEGEARVPQLEADIKANAGSKAQLQQDLEEHKTTRTEGQQAVGKAEEMRKKESEQFQAESSENRNNIKAIGKAIAALEKGMGESFLQTGDGTILKKLMMGDAFGNLDPEDRSEVNSFLQSGSGGEIVGILKQMKEGMEKDLTESEQSEADAQASFEALVSSKTKEISAASSAIEGKSLRLGDVSVALSNAKNDLTDTEAALTEDQTFLGNLKKSCAVKAKEWELRQQTRSEELVAISETVKILNDDETLELMKKTAGRSSAGLFLIQTGVSSKAEMKRAASMVRTANMMEDPRLDLISMAIHGKKGGMAKIVKMIDDMVSLLKKEQVDDDKKKAFCEKEKDSNEDELKDNSRGSASTQAELEELKGAIEGINDEITTLQKGILALDKSVAEASEQRKAEHAEFQGLQSSNNQAVELLEFAKNRLNKFYNPNQYEAPTQQPMSEEDRLFAAGGGEIPTQAPGGIAGTGIGLFVQVSSRTRQPGPPPETFGGGYEKKQGESGGVIVLMDNMINDVKKETHEAEMEEKEAQKDYDETVTDADKKKEADSQSITEKQTAAAAAGENLQDAKDKLNSLLQVGAALSATKANLHADCDVLQQNYESRKAARTNEIEGLQKAKGVLHGADYSFVQYSSSLRGRTKQTVLTIG